MANTASREPAEAAGLAPGEGDPQPQVLVYATGHKPIIRVRVDGRWRIAVVRERHDRPSGTVYQVLLDCGSGPVIRTYPWPSTDLEHVFTPPR
jgi:hypothetical protein